MTTLAEKLKVVRDKAIKRNEEEEKIRIQKKIKLERDMIIQQMKEAAEKGELLIKIRRADHERLEPEVIMHLCKDDGFYIRCYCDVYSIAVSPIWKEMHSGEYGDSFYGPAGKMYKNCIISWKEGVTFNKQVMQWDSDYHSQKWYWVKHIVQSKD